MADIQQKPESTEEQKSAAWVPLMARATNAFVDFIVSVPIFLVIWAGIGAFSDKEELEKLQHADALLQDVVNNFEPWHLITYYREAGSFVHLVVFGLLDWIMKLVYIPKEIIGLFDIIPMEILGIIVLFKSWLYLTFSMVVLGFATLVVPFVILFDIFAQGRIIEGILTLPIYLACYLAWYLLWAHSVGTTSKDGNDYFWISIIMAIALVFFLLWTVKLVMVIASELFSGYVHLASLSVSCAACASFCGWFFLKRTEHSVSDLAVHWARHQVNNVIKRITH